MLMSIMINRVRVTLALLERAGKLSKRIAPKERRVFSEKVIEEMIAALGNRPPLKVPAKKMITREGGSGGSMYVVLSGRVAVFVNKVMVDNVGPGGMIGEIALVDGASRAITTLAESDVTLLAVTRNDFLKMVKSRFISESGSMIIQRLKRLWMVGS